MRGKLFLLPVRRKLTAVCAAYLAGACLAGTAAPFLLFCMILCAFLTAWGAVRLARRKSALFCAVGAMFAVGGLLAGAQLRAADVPTEGKTQISGVVCAIESGNRVYLSDVQADGGPPPKRRVLVTLMEQDGQTREQVRVGQRIIGTGRLFAQREARNPGGVNERVRALARGYELSGYVLPGWEAQGAGTFSLREAMRRLREALAARMQRVFGEGAPLFQAMLLGERGEMDADVTQAMRLTGTAHLLTVSGLHLSLIALAMESLFRRLPLGRRGRFAALTVILGAYAMLTGGAPGTVRAFIMALLRALSVCRGRKYDPLTALAAAALGMTLVNPALARGAGFRFSFFVVLGLLLLSGGASSWLARRRGFRRFPRACHALAVSLCAQMAAMPMELLLYGYVPLTALPMNLLAGALAPLLMLGGALSVAAHAVCPALGRLMGGGMAAVAAGFERVSLFAAQAGVCRLPAPYALALPLCAAAMALASRTIRFGKRRRRALNLTLAALLLLYAPRLCPLPRYAQLDVGQGDAAALRSGRRAALVDVGPVGSYDALRYLRHEGLVVDAVILSHLDADHAGALGTLLRSEVAVGRIVLADGAEDGEVAQTVTDALALAREKHVPILSVSAGDAFASAGAAFSVLSPTEGLTGSNERSLALLAEMPGMRLLTLGDLPASCEMADAPDCDVLKVAHHGSKAATSAALIRRASPQIALISVGDNAYGHPSARVLDDLAASGARVYRTDEAGCVTLWPLSDGVRVQTYCRPPS